MWTFRGDVDLKASEYYKSKPVNVINQVWHINGTVTIRIYKEGWKRSYTFKVKNYGTPEETILEDEDVEE